MGFGVLSLNPIFSLIINEKTMQGIGEVSFRTLTDTEYNISFDESVCCMLFDLSGWDDEMENFPVINSIFGKGEPRRVSSIGTAVSYGLINSNFMGGIPTYHITEYFKYIGGSRELYVCLRKCESGGKPDFSFIEDLQSSVGGRVFQLGVWTEQRIFNADGTLSGLIGNLNSNLMGMGIAGNMSNGTTPLSAMLFAHIDKDTDYRALPEIVSCKAPKVSVFLGQRRDDATTLCQSKTKTGTPVGLMGMCLAVLSMSGAEESIGCVGKYNLNKDDRLIEAELGFGVDGTPMDDINEIQLNILTLKGYVTLTRYDAIESGIFFSNDQTLSDGDYDTISKNRLMHKAKRIIKRALLPHVNSGILLDGDGKISQTEVTSISNDVYDMMDANMVTRLGQRQLSGRSVEIPRDDNQLLDDTLRVKVVMVPVSSNSELVVEESVSR